MQSNVINCNTLAFEEYQRRFTIIGLYGESYYLISYIAFVLHVIYFYSFTARIVITMYCYKWIKYNFL